MKIDYTKLKEGDVVFTTSNTPIAVGIRLRTGGFFDMFKQDIPNHVGILVEWKSLLFMVEMLGNGISVNSLKNYDGNSYSNGKIHSIWRSDSPSIMKDRISRDVVNLILQAIKYDFKGIASFLGIAQQSNKRFYCSEMVAKVLTDSWAISEKKDKWSPNDLFAYFKNNKEKTWEEVKNFYEE